MEDGHGFRGIAKIGSIIEVVCDLPDQPSCYMATNVSASRHFNLSSEEVSLMADVRAEELKTPRLSVISRDPAGSVVWDLETYMRIRREVEMRELCCSISKIDAKLEQFPTLNVKYIIRTAERRHLDEDLKKHLDPLNEYLKTCCFDRNDAMVKQQLEGIQELHVTLCLDKVFNEQLSKYSKCLYDVVTTTGDCLVKESNQSMKNTSDKDICPRLRAIVDCFTIQAVDDCSMAASNIFNKLFKRVIKATVRVDCGACFHVLPDSELATSLDKGKIVTSVLVLSMIIFSLVLLRWNSS